MHDDLGSRRIADIRSPMSRSIGEKTVGTLPTKPTCISSYEYSFSRRTAQDGMKSIAPLVGRVIRLAGSMAGIQEIRIGSFLFGTIPTNDRERGILVAG